MTKCTKIYSEPVLMDKETRSYLVSCYRNHLVIYNEMLEVYRKDKTMTYKQLKAKLAELLAKGIYSPVISSVLHSEIYYMHKKADFKQKLVTDIQYMTTISAGYKGNKILLCSADRTRLRFNATPLSIKLSKPLPVLEPEDETIYMNLSYPGGGGLMELSVFAKPEA